MPFEIIESVKKPTLTGVIKASYRGKKHKTLCFIFPKALIQLPAKYYQLQIGNGADANKFRLLPSNKENLKAFQVINLKHAQILRFGHIPQLGTEAWPYERELIITNDPEKVLYLELTFKEPSVPTAKDSLTDLIRGNLAGNKG